MVSPSSQDPPGLSFLKIFGDWNTLCALRLCGEKCNSSLHAEVNRAPGVVWCPDLATLPRTTLRPRWHSVRTPHKLDQQMAKAPRTDIYFEYRCNGFHSLSFRSWCVCIKPWLSPDILLEYVHLRQSWLPKKISPERLEIRRLAENIPSQHANV